MVVDIISVVFFFLNERSAVATWNEEMDEITEKPP